MILITGGAGYIGSHTNKLLNKLGYETVVFDNLVYGHEEFAKWGEFVCGDLNDGDLLDNVFKMYPIDAVIHFAAYTYVGESTENPGKYYRNNVFCTLNLLDSMIANNVKNIVFSSTCAIYGVPDSIPITEGAPKNPINPYGASKFMVERILNDYDNAYGLKYVALRYFNAAGADPNGEIGEWHEPETHLIPLVLDAALGKREDIKVFGSDYNTPDGSCIRDYVHVSDIASAHEKALVYLKDENKSNCFNLGYGNGYSVIEIIKTAEEVTGKKIKMTAAGRRAGDPPILVGSNKKIIDTLKWNPSYNDIKTIISHAWNWHTRQR